MSKLKTLVKALATVQETVSLLNSVGIDVDRIVGISNAQGPQAKLIQAILNGAMSDDSARAVLDVLPASPLVGNDIVPASKPKLLKRAKKKKSPPTKP